MAAAAASAISAGLAAGPVVLASASPQRTAILSQLGIEHEILVADLDELETGDPIAVATENARAKAAAVAAQRPGRVVLGADTVVVVLGADGEPEIFGKPSGRDQARAMLRRLLGADHVVISGLAVVIDEHGGAGHLATTVRMRAVPDAVLERYLDSDEWRGRAGGYAIQGRGSALVSEIQGDYWNVVGLPIPLLAAALPELVDGLQFDGQPCAEASPEG